MIWVILLLSVAALGGLIAYAGDTVGRRIGKKHYRLFGLRPKATGLLIAVLSGVAVALVTVGTVALLARNTLDNAIRAQEIRADLETAKRQLGVVNEEYEIAKRDLEQARSAQKTLEDQLASNRAQLSAKQRELSSAVDLFGRLKTRADELEALNTSSSVKLAERDAALKDIEAQRRKLSLKITELGRKRDELQSRIATLTAEKQDFEKRYEATQARLNSTETRLNSTETRLTSSQERLTSSQERLTSSQERLTSTQARLEKVEAQVRDFEASRSTLEGDINELIQTKASLEKSNQDLQSQNTQLEKELADIDQNLKETRSALALATQGEFIYRRNELIVQAVLPEGSPDQVRSKLSSIVRQASLIVESRGAARGKPLALLPNNDLEPYVAQAIRSGGPDLVMVRATRNLTRGLQVPVTLDIRPNRTLYLASQPIRSLEITLGGTDGAPRASDVLERLQSLLREVRNDLRTKNVPVENINPPDVIPDEEVAEFADRLRAQSGSTVIGVAGRQDVLPSGPLRFYFFVLR